MSFKTDESNLRRSNFGTMNRRADGSNSYDPPRGRGPNLPNPMSLDNSRRRQYPGETVGTIPAVLTGAATRSYFNPSLVFERFRGQGSGVIERFRSKALAFLRPQSVPSVISARGSHLGAGGVKQARKTPPSVNRASPIDGEHRGSLPFDNQRAMPAGPAWKVFLWDLIKDRIGEQ